MRIFSLKSLPFAAFFLSLLLGSAGFLNSAAAQSLFLQGTRPASKEAPKETSQKTTPAERVTSGEISVIHMGLEGVGANEKQELETTRRNLSAFLILLKNPGSLSSLTLENLHRNIEHTLENINRMVAQMESYANSLNSLVQVLGETPVANEDPAISQQRREIQKNQRNIKAALVEAKLYQIQARQLESFSDGLRDKLQHQILIKRSLSPVLPAFWQKIYQEKTLSDTLLQDSGGLKMTLLLFGGAIFNFLLILFFSHQMGKIFPKIFRAWAKANIELNLHAPPSLSLLSRVFTSRASKQKNKKLEILEQEETILRREELNAVPLGTLGQLLIGVICVVSALIFWNLWTFFIHGENYGLAQVINSCIPACALILGAGLPLLGWTRGKPRPVSSFLMAISLVMAANLVGLLEREIIAPNFAAFLQGAVALLDAFSLSLLFRVRKRPLVKILLKKNDAADSEMAEDSQKKFESILSRRWLLFHCISLGILTLTIFAILTGYMTMAFIINTQLLVLVYDIALLCLLVGTWKQISTLILSPGQLGFKKLQALGLSQSRIEQMKVLTSATGTVFAGAMFIAIFANGVHFSLFDLYERLERIFLGALFADIPISPKMLLSCAFSLCCAYYFIQLICLWLTTRLFPTTQLSSGSQTSILTIFTYTTWILSGVFCLTLLGVSVSSLTWVVSALSVGVGFGLQSIVKDFVSGIMLLAERPIQPGDTIEVAGASGEVQRIAMRATSIALPDGVTMIVPNSQFITSVVKNSSYGAKPSRMVINFDFPANVDLSKISRIIMKVVGLQKDILVSPPPLILVNAVYGPDINFCLRFWYPSNGSSAKIKSAFLQALFAELKAQGEHENIVIKG